MILNLICCTKKQVETEKIELSNGITNSLINGNSCKSFERLLEGNKMEDLTSVKQTKDGGYIFCGSTETESENEYDILIVKTDCFGKTEWIKKISNNYSDFGYDIIELSTGGYLLIAVNSIDPNNYKIVSYQGQILKLDNLGNLVWKKTLQIGYKTELKKILDIKNGEFIICGIDNSLGGLILKIDALGNQIWLKYLEDNTRLNDISIKGNNLIACGLININQQDDLFLVEIDLLGKIIWTKIIDKDNNSNAASSIQTINNSEIVISGTNRTSGTTFSGFVMRLDNLGNEIWYKNLESDGIKFVNKLLFTNKKEIFGIGSKSNSPLTLMKFDYNNGSINWITNIYPKSANSTAKDFQLTSDDGFIFSGNVFKSVGNRDGYILKTDQNGN
jgi:hypothetical protein